MSLLQEAQAMEQEIIGWRRYFHENPELGLELPKTAAKVQEELKKMGVRFRPCGQSGVLGYIGKEGGKSILLRGDMDALPLTEDTGLPYASQCPGKMHACGHDTHAAMLLGAAKLLKAHEEELQGLVILMFQPGEETLSGARSMIEDGCLENPKPDHAVAIHIAGEPYQTGQVKLSRGTIAASSDNYRILLHGKGGHGASPQNSINPIFAAAKIVEAFTDIGRYEVDPQQPTVVNTCSIHAGTTYNIIPNDCEIRGTVRTFNEEVRANLLSRIQETVEKICSLYRCTFEFYNDFSTPSNYSEETFSDELYAMLKRDLEGVEVLPLDSSRMMGSEDFAYVSQKISSCSLSLGASNPDIPHFPAHHPKVQFDEKAFAYGTATYAQAALSYLK